MVSTEFTGRLKTLLVVLLKESVTVTVNETGVESGGVPVSTPDELMDNQAGSPEPLHEYVPDPPDAVKVRE